jgi:hypothetical protein
VRRPFVTACVVAAALTVAAGASPALAQGHGEAPPKAAAPAKPAAPAPSPRAPVIAPGKPIVAPRIGPSGDSGALPTAARNPKTARVSISARQAAASTIAALVEAMKNMPKRPPAPPEPRTSTARRAGTATRAPDPDLPPPINYHVTWPAKAEEVGVTKRVELAWPGASSGGSGVSLRWNEPTPE